MLNIIRTLIIATKRLFLERHTYQASALAYSTLLSLIPLLSITLSFISIFPIFSKFTTTINDYFLTNLNPTSNAVIGNYIEQFIEKTNQLPVISILFFLFVVVMLIITIEDSFDDIWHESKKKTISWMIVHWLMVIFITFLIGLGILLSSNLFSSRWVLEIINNLGIKTYLLVLLTLFINTLIFSTLYIIVPNCRVNWLDAFSGGLIAALLLEGGKRAFGFYIKKLANYELIYGALATIPIFLIWLYISWLIILFGAIFVHVRYKERYKLLRAK